MRLKNYKADLLQRLEDAEYAAEYLSATLAEKDRETFLLALKDVVEARGGIGDLAERIKLNRASLYRTLSADGNPTFETLQQILGSLGLRVSIVLEAAA